MKISASIRRLYSEQREQIDRLKKEVDAFLRGVTAEKNWHYESRVKAEASIALKLESGRIGDPKRIEDFFACTIVVKNMSELADAESIVRSKFKFVERRPKDDSWTHKSSDAFPFDDIRLYSSWEDDASAPPTGLDGLLFEIQIKTFLQHAWSIATHDLVYKTDNVSWSRERIAYQIKAMLEHAEISILEASRIAVAPTLDKENRDTKSLKQLIKLLQKTWSADLLPQDLRRLAGNVQGILKITGLDVDGLQKAIKKEEKRQHGQLPSNISPYAIIVQAIAWHSDKEMKLALTDQQKRGKIFITDEMELPDWMSAPEIINIVKI